MNIVYFIDHLRPDGAQFVLWQLVDGLAQRGHRQTVLCLNDSWDEQFLEKVRNTGAEVRIIGKAALASGIGLGFIYTLLRREKPDAVVTMLFVSDVVGRSLARLAGVKRIITSIQTRDEFYSEFQRRLVRFTMPWAHVVELCSNNLREFVITEEGADPDKIVVIPHSIRVLDYEKPEDLHHLRDEFKIEPDGLLIGSLGRLTHQKGFDNLIEAVRGMHGEKIQVVLAGVGEDEGKLRALVSESGLENRVHLAGYRRDIPHFLHSLDLYVQPSRYEGMPLAVLQAMAAGCPIVASAVDGICELIEDGVHGWLVPPEDPGRLAAALTEALHDRNEAAKRGSAAKARAQSCFNLDDMITAWEALILDSPYEGEYCDG
jgi:glycosyltransferase involved in cell wall biosynthesis